MAGYTDAQRRDILEAIATWDPSLTAVDLRPRDCALLREDIVEQLVPVIGGDLDRSISRMEALRMAAS